MGLSKDLISQFAKITNDNNKSTKEETVYGTIIKTDGITYLKMDGSELLTPITSTTDVEDGERVMAMIKNHQAIVTGNVSSPAARTDTVKEINGKVDKLEANFAKIDTIVAEKVEAELVEVDSMVAEKVEAKVAELDVLTVDEANIKYATVENLEVANEKVTNLETSKLSVDEANIKYATIENLDITNQKVTDLETKKLSAEEADIKYATIENLNVANEKVTNLETSKLNAKDAELTYANIDFANINEAAVKKIFSDTGLIKDLVVGDQTITGELVGVTIIGDYIKAGTVKADKLVVKGSDGLYYKLNFESGNFAGGEEVPDDSLHGSIITANSITAEKISVKDLVAFGATIGGFNISENSIYSGTKSSATNTTRGVYLDKEGQFSVGDANNFIKFFKDTDGVYKLHISAQNITFGSSGTSVEDAINDVSENAIVSSIEEFYQSSSATALSGGSWSTSQPAWTQGKYIWRRTKNKNGNGTITYSPSETGVCITGNTGATGAQGEKGDTGATGAQGAKGDKGDKGDTGATGAAGTSVTIKSTSVTYQASSSGTTTPTGTWSATVPTVNNGQYLWTKTVVTYSTGTSTTSYSVAYKGTNGTNGTNGTRGSAWYTGTAITGTSTTATIFSSSGISSALVNDMYLNTSTGYTYKCTVAGAAAAAKWVYAGSIKGATGAQGAKGDKGDTGATGATGASGKMLFGVCSTSGTARTVTIDGVTSYYDGLCIAVKFTVATTTSMTLNVNSLGAKTVYYANTTTGGYCPANYMVILVYETSTNSSGCWKMAYSYNSDTYDRTRYNGNVKASAAIVAGNIIVGNSSGYHHLKAGTAFDISYPILYAASAIASGSAGTNNFSVYPLTITTTQSITLTSYKNVYIKGKLSGNTFTPVSTTPLTQTEPTSDDGYWYILLGLARSTTQIFFDTDHTVYKYFSGKFQKWDATANYVNFINGIIVGDKSSGSITGNNILIDTDSVDIRKGDTILASYGADYIYLAKNSQNAVIDMCNGLIQMRSETTEYDQVGFLIDAPHAISMFAPYKIRQEAYFDNGAGQSGEAIFSMNSHKIEDGAALPQGNVLLTTKSYSSSTEYTNTSLLCHNGVIDLYCDTTVDSGSAIEEWISGLTVKPTEVNIYSDQINLKAPITKCSGDIYIPNGDALYGYDSTGVVRSLIYINSNNKTIVGYGGYAKGYETDIYGNNIIMTFNAQAQITGAGSISLTCGGSTTVSGGSGGLTLSGGGGGVGISATAAISLTSSSSKSVLVNDIELGKTSSANCTIASGFALYNTSSVCKVVKYGKTVTLYGTLKNTAEATYNTTAVTMFTIPSGYRPPATLRAVCQGSGMNRWLLSVTSGGTATIQRYGVSSYPSVAAGAWLDFTMTWVMS